MTIEIWSINHKDRNISLCLCGMMLLRNHFCKKSVSSGQHPPINSLHVRPWSNEISSQDHGKVRRYSLVLYLSKYVLQLDVGLTSTTWLPVKT